MVRVVQEIDATPPIAGGSQEDYPVFVHKVAAGPLLLANCPTF